MSDDQLRGFLDGLGLIELLEAFTAERIELADLELLSDADLAALGVPLGPRRRIMAALADGTPGDRPVAGERRNLTVMFCDMVDSTAVASQFDPEDLRTRYRDYRNVCVAAIEAEGGFVAHRLGDGLMAYFGFPRALEDAAIRAVRAGLEIVARAADLSTPGGRVKVRIGIASGLTVIEEARQGHVAKDEMATGATLSLAARLQSFAEPGTVVVSDATRKLLHDAFDLHPLGKKTLKGFPEAEAVWLVTSKTPMDRLAGIEEPAAGEFFGREAVRADLLGWWWHSLRGSGRSVLIEGEPGIGKSRLLAELRRAAAPDGDIVSLQCSRYRHGAALHPVLEWLEAAIGCDDDDKRRARLAKLPGVAPATLPLLGAIMNLEPQATKPEGDPIDRQNAIVDAVVDLLATPAGSARMLLVEDLHWADDTTLDILDRLAECAGDRALLLVATTRPDAARLPREGDFCRITLAPLSRAETDRLITTQTGADGLPESVRQTILERSGGIPFFAEELTRAVLEAPGTSGAEVPITLQDALMSRLDRLDAGKPVALFGALIGHRFSRALLAACSDLSEAHIRAGLTELLASNLVKKQPGTEQGYAFRHALVRDVAYESILRSRRSDLHRRVADAVKKHFPAMADSRPEMVAHHFTEAGAVASAIEYWEKAAERAGSHAAPTSAIAYFNTALGLLKRLPESPLRDEQETHLRVRLNLPLTITTGFSSDKTEENLSRMAELYEVAEPSEAAIQLLWSRCMSALVRADLLSAQSTALHLRQATRHTKLPNATRVPERILAYVALLEGRLYEAEEHFSRVLHGYSPGGFDPILPGHPFDVLASTLSQRAILWALRGQAAAVDADQERAITRARELDNLPTSFQVLVHICIARFEMGDHAGVVPLISELREVVDRSEMAPLYVELWEAWLLAKSGATDEGLNGMARAQRDRLQYPLWRPGALLLQADVMARAGRHKKALALIDECDVDIKRLRHTYLEAEAKRRRAAFLSLDGEPDDEVEALLRDAMEIASRQGALQFEQAARNDLDLLQRGLFQPFGPYLARALPAR